MNLKKCDKCGNRNIMCFLCENNKHYRETKYSHDNFIKNKAIDEFAERIKQDDVIEYMSSDVSYEAIVSFINEIAEQLKGDVTYDRE